MAHSAVMSLLCSERSQHDSARPGDSVCPSLYQMAPADLLPPVKRINLEEIEVFTHQQIEAMREHRYGNQRRETVSDRSRDREIGSLQKSLVALAAGLARIGTRAHKGKSKPASPAY